jgi:predicted dinucleotide-utilizing enzyme
MNFMPTQPDSHVKLVGIDDTPESLELITEALSQEALRSLTPPILKTVWI